MLLPATACHSQATRCGHRDAAVVSHLFLVEVDSIVVALGYALEEFKCPDLPLDFDNR